MIQTLAKTSLCALIIAGAACTNNTTPSSDKSQTARKDIHIVGSSTVYPFAAKTAQEFSNITGHKVVVESTGSGGGHKLFCQGNGANTPDITTSSRRQKKSEFDLCKRNGVKNIIEGQVGIDGIIIANKIDAQPHSMRIRDIYLALAKNVPTSETDCTLRSNPNSNWQQINPSLPDHKIQAYGPPPTSGTRDAFVEIAMELGANSLDCLAALRETDPVLFTETAHTLREDGMWIDGGENDDALVQTLMNAPTAIGILGYSFLDQNSDTIKALDIDGAIPTFENISNGTYPVSRSLYFYIKKDHIDNTPGLLDYVLEFVSDQASGPNGYLEDIGLVPLKDRERLKVREDIKNQISYSQ